MIIGGKEILGRLRVVTKHVPRTVTPQRHTYEFSISSVSASFVYYCRLCRHNSSLGLHDSLRLRDFFYCLKINSICMCNLPFIFPPSSVFKNHLYLHFVTFMLFFPENILTAFALCGMKIFNFPSKTLFKIS